MDNIFSNAYFGKAYKARDGRKAIFQNFNGDLCEMILPDCSFNVWKDGLFDAGQEGSLDIVSEWHEEINEEKLDALKMRYLSQVSLYKSLYQGLVDKACEWLRLSMRYSTKVMRRVSMMRRIIPT